MANTQSVEQISKTAENIWSNGANANPHFEKVV